MELKRVDVISGSSSCSPPPEEVGHPGEKGGRLNGMLIAVASQFKELNISNASRTRNGRLVGLGSLVCVWAAVALTLGVLPGRTGIAPRIQSDYCYQLLAADRFYDGFGFTSLQPVAPLQPWQWRYDWGYLTQWPPGLAMLIVGLRRLLGVSTVTACQWLGVLACSTALVGWYLWLRRIVPSGWAGVLLAATAAGCALPVHYLVDPSSDVMLAALLPLLLLLTVGRGNCSNSLLKISTPSLKVSEFRNATAATECGRYGMQPATYESGEEVSQPSMLRMGLAGLLAGGLIWLRYAAIFLAPAIGCHLLIQWWLHRAHQFRQPDDSEQIGATADAAQPLPYGRGTERRCRIRFRHVACFMLCAALPMSGLVVTNRVLGAGPAQQQFNVGHSIGMHLTPQLVLSAWENFTHLGFYDYHWFSRWIWTLWPAALLVVSLSAKPWRRAFLSFIARPAVCVSACALFGCLTFLIAATSLFGDKFDYVALMRYYDPIRPFYFALFVAPLLLIRHRIARVAVGLTCFVACTWIVQQEWRRPYQKLLQSQQAATPYGQAEEAFPGRSAQLYGWLAGQGAPELILISNFHEYLSLETRIAAFPIPEDVDTLHRWMNDIRRARGVNVLRVLFVLDADNRWRSYWQPDPVETARRFNLQPAAGVPEGLAGLVFEYGPRGVKLAAEPHDSACTVLPVSDTVPAIEWSRGLKPDPEPHDSACAVLPVSDTVPAIESSRGLKPAAQGQGPWLGIGQVSSLDASATTSFRNSS